MNHNALTANYCFCLQNKHFVRTFLVFFVDCIVSLIHCLPSDLKRKLRDFGLEIIKSSLIIEALNQGKVVMSWFVPQYPTSDVTAVKPGTILTCIFKFMQMHMRFDISGDSPIFGEQ